MVENIADINWFWSFTGKTNQSKFTNVHKAVKPTNKKMFYETLRTSFLLESLSIAFIWMLSSLLKLKLKNGGQQAPPPFKIPHSPNVFILVFSLGP